MAGPNASEMPPCPSSGSRTAPLSPLPAPTPDRSPLQNVITTDLDALKAGEIKPGALLTPQARSCSTFWSPARAKTGSASTSALTSAADFAKRLTLYKLRAKAEIIKQDRVDVAVAWENDSTSSENDSTAFWFVDTRFRDVTVRRSYDGEAGATAGIEAWTALRIA